MNPIIPLLKEKPAFELEQLQAKAVQLGFAQLSIANFDTLPQAKQALDDWLANNLHGTMDYMARNAHIRANPAELLPKARSALLLRMDYLPNPGEQMALSAIRINEPNQAQISFYAQGRDYHTVLRQRAKKLVNWLQTQAPEAEFRVFTDSAPVMEVELAQSSGLGWRGKHTLLLNRDAGSVFFLGGILTTLELPISKPQTGHCGQCTACLEVCPTQAILAPYQVDARRCISYLTIEHVGSIDEALRPLMGNRIYGCDDCQTACPWNKFAQKTVVTDFSVRNDLDHSSLLNLWHWSESDFLERMQGSAIRRIGHARWLRNIATAMGNSLRIEDSPDIRKALRIHKNHPDNAVREHVVWALNQTVKNKALKAFTI
jgi:epoxyqueuosine reductase